MVLLQHESLHQTLWGPAAQRGRTKRTDVAIYVQLVLSAAAADASLVILIHVWLSLCVHQTIYALLSVCCALEYEKPVAVRLGATAAGTLLYFRNTALRAELINSVVPVAIGTVCEADAARVVPDALWRHLPPDQATRRGATGDLGTASRKTRAVLHRALEQYSHSLRSLLIWSAEKPGKATASQHEIKARRAIHQER